MSVQRVPVSSPEHGQDLLVCKFHEFGCPAAWLTPEALEEHMRDDANAHLELVYRALQVERSLKEHHKEAMTNAQSRCRKLEKEIIQCKAESAKLDQQLSSAQQQLAQLNRLSAGDLRIRNIIGSFLYGDAETVRGFTPLIPATVGASASVPAVRDRAILGVSLCDALRQQADTIRDLQATVSSLEEKLQGRDQELARLSLRSRSFGSSEEGAVRPRARPVGPMLFPRGSVSGVKPFRFQLQPEVSKSHQEAWQREYDELLGEMLSLLHATEETIAQEPQPQRARPRQLSYLCPYTLYRKATTLITKRPKAPVGEQGSEPE